MTGAHRSTKATLGLCLSTLGIAGCQGILGTPNTAQIRIIDASPDAPMLDIYQGPSALSYNLAFGNITSYIEISSGLSDLAANASGSHQTLASIRETLSPGQYTLLFGNTTSNLQPLLIKDQTMPAPTGQVAFRFVDQAAASSAFDIYLVPPGYAATAFAPFITNEAFNGNSGYLNLPAGSYRIILYPSGIPLSNSVPAAYSGPTVIYPSGAVRTVVLLDQRNPLRPSVQAVTATDFEPTPRAN